jgi:glycosyltransferase involved in cell wall biosynthesis
MPGLSIIIPAYNEAKTIHLILDKVRAVELTAGLGKEVIIVKRLFDRCHRRGYQTVYG